MIIKTISIINKLINKLIGCLKTTNQLNIIADKIKFLMIISASYNQSDKQKDKA